MVPFEIEIVGKRKRKPIKYEIDKNECWNCTSHYKNKAGYPKIFDHGSIKLMSRYIYTKFVKEIPKGLCILHSCDNPACINPNHLRIGTMTENMEDKCNRHRQARVQGIKNPNAKLSLKQVTDIIQDSRPQTVIAKDYGVHNSTICLIKHNKIWRGLSL